MFQNLRNKAAKLATAALALVAAAPSFATGSAVDVSATVTSITDQLTPIGLLGVAVLGIIVAIKAFKWVRRAM